MFKTGKIQIYLLITLLCIPVFAISQITSKIDSFETAFSNIKKTEGKYRELLKFSKMTENTDLKVSLKYARKAYVSAKQNGNVKGQVNSLFQIGYIYLNLGEYENALLYAQKSYDLAFQQDMFIDVTYANDLLSAVYYQLGDFERCVRYDFETLEYFETINDKKQIGISFGNIGIDFMRLKSYSKALKYFNKSLNIAVRIKDSAGIAYQYNNIAAIYLDAYGQKDKAVNYYRKALKINKKLGDIYQIGINLMNIGTIFSEKTEYDSSYYYFYDALINFKKYKNPLLTAQCELYIGQYYYNINQFDSSTHIAKTVYDKANKLKSNKLIIEASDLLRKIFLNKGDTLSAYKYLNISKELNEELLAHRNNDELYKLEFLYNNAKIEKIKEQKEQKKKFMFIFIISTLIFLGFILFLLYSRQRIKVKNTLLKNKAISAELKNKNLELTANLVTLMKKNEMITDISKELNKIKKEAKSITVKNIIGDISRRVQRNINNKMYKEFSIRFKEVHIGYYDRLLSKYPGLSNNELRLCAYLRLNLSSKDISELTGQRISTIENARYRLRKKLGISNTETNLVTFLSKI